TILFRITGTPTGVLRLFNKFAITAKQRILTASLNLSGVLLAWVMDGALQHYLLAFGMSNIVGNLFLVAMGWQELRSRGINQIWSSRLLDLPRKDPGVWRFVLYTNL